MLTRLRVGSGQVDGGIGCSLAMKISALAFSFGRYVMQSLSSFERILVDVCERSTK